MAMGVDKTRHDEFAPAVEDAGLGVRRTEIGLGGRVGRNEGDAVVRNAHGTLERAGLVADGGHRQDGSVGEKERQWDKVKGEE